MINKKIHRCQYEKNKTLWVFSSKWDTYITPLAPKSQESWWKSGTESLTEPEAVYVFNETVFAGHDRERHCKHERKAAVTAFERYAC